VSGFTSLNQSLSLAIADTIGVLVAAMVDPAIESRYTSGSIVYLRTLSIPSQRFTDSKKPSPAALESADVNGQ
jgi:hypothetical protein